jgi:outer membrane lipase/esterase
MTAVIRSVLGALVASGLFCIATYACAYSDLVVFGDSISDSGNNAIVFGSTRTPVPPGSPTDIVPGAPYASDRYTNGPVWVEYLAGNLGLSARPALAGGTNFASGGARSGPLGSIFPFSLRDQVHTFATLSGNMAPKDGLYILQGGGNDARDIASGAVNPATGIAAFAGNMTAMVAELQAAGARSIIVANVPDIGKTPEMLAGGPALAAQASALASQMNSSLAMALDAAPGPAKVEVFDVFGLMNQVLASPADFGFTDTTAICVLSAACLADPSKYLFWDSIHPTTAGHRLLAEHAMVSAMPEPETYALLIAGLFLLAFALRRQRPR